MNYNANDILEIMKCANNYNNRLAAYMTKLIERYNYLKVIDFGCADGYFAEIFKNRFPDIDLTGIETDDNSINCCKRKKLKVTDNIDNIDNRVDLIYSFNVLEHIEDDCEILRKMHDKITENGRLLIYVPAMMFLFSSMDKKVGHYRRYSKNEIKEKLTKTGFKIEKINYCDCLGIPATLLYKLFDKLFGKNNGSISKTMVKLYDFIFPLSLFLDFILFGKLAGKNLCVVARK